MNDSRDGRAENIDWEAMTPAEAEALARGLYEASQEEVTPSTN